MRKLHNFSFIIYLIIYNYTTFYTVYWARNKSIWILLQKFNAVPRVVPSIIVKIIQGIFSKSVSASLSVLINIHSITVKQWKLFVSILWNIVSNKSHTAPLTLITTGTMVAFFSFHNFLISSLWSWHFSVFSPFLCLLLVHLLEWWCRWSWPPLLAYQQRQFLVFIELQPSSHTVHWNLTELWNLCFLPLTLGCVCTTSWSTQVLSFHTVHIQSHIVIAPLVFMLRQLAALTF